MSLMQKCMSITESTTSLMYCIPSCMVQDIKDQIQKLKQGGSQNTH